MVYLAVFTMLDHWLGAGQLGQETFAVLTEASLAMLYIQ